MNRVLASCVLVLLATYFVLSQPAPSPSHLTDQQRVDNAIAEIVLSDMTTRDGDEMGFSFFRERIRTIYVYERGPEWIGDVDSALRDYETGESAVADRLDVIEAIQNIKDRHASGVSLSTYRPRNQCLRMVPFVEPSPPVVYTGWYLDWLIWWHTSDFGGACQRLWLRSPFATPYQARLPIEVSAPGYSNNGNIAVIWIYCPEYHPSFGTYVLERTGKTWRIVATGFRVTL